MKRHLRPLPLSVLIELDRSLHNSRRQAISTTLHRRFYETLWDFGDRPFRPQLQITKVPSPEVGPDGSQMLR